MTNFPSQPELDDELLSAYLDGELSAEVHAAVEARLAADPAARELLHQLRAVSQAVQGLPQEVVGHDLGEAIVRRVEESRRSGGAALRTLPQAEAAPQVLSNVDAVPAGPTLPRFTVGRTRRGWAWATLAVAAALLIMVFQSDPNRNENLPVVAQREETLEDMATRHPAADDHLELRAVTKPAAPAAVDLAEFDARKPTDSNTDAVEARSLGARAPDQQPPAPLDTAAGRARRVATTQALEPSNAPVPPMAAPTVAMGIEPLADRDVSPPAAAAGTAPAQVSSGFAASEQADGLAAPALPAGALDKEWQDGADEKAAFGESSQLAHDEQLVVVHVLAKRAALENKTFEQLLATNGIQVAANEAKDAGVAEGAVSLNQQLNRQLAEESETRFGQEPAAQLAQNATAEEEVVLVEAPTTAILSCLEGLRQDEVNFVGIDVEDTTERELLRESAAAPTADFAAIEDARKRKKLTEELGLAKYNRGIMPQKQELSTRDKAFYYRYYDMDAQGDRYAGAGGYGGGYGGFGGRGGLPQAQKELADASGARAPQSAANFGRAVRLRAWGIEAPQLGAQQTDEKLTRGEAASTDLHATATAEKFGEMHSELNVAAGPQTDTLQVLFVLRPSEDAAPSPPAGNQAK